ncbi:hypothetical protein FHG87_024608 [Trinorchestia longiramus]|nr:hypothetical protein FHG87_024608 [Trinorchestia longiramus]
MPHSSLASCHTPRWPHATLHATVAMRSLAMPHHTGDTRNRAPQHTVLTAAIFNNLLAFDIATLSSVAGRVEAGRRRMSRQDSVHELEDLACKLSPNIEGRIIVASPECVSLNSHKPLYQRLLDRLTEEQDDDSESRTPEAPQQE